MDDSIRKLEEQTQVLIASVKLLTMVIEEQDGRIAVLEGTNYGREKHD